MYSFLLYLMGIFKEAPCSGHLVMLPVVVCKTEKGGWLPSWVVGRLSGWLAEWVVGVGCGDELGGHNGNETFHLHSHSAADLGSKIGIYFELDSQKFGSQGARAPGQRRRRNPDFRFRMFG